MTTEPVARLIETLGQLHLLSPAQLQELTRRLPEGAGEPRKLLGTVVGRAWLTEYQARRLLAGQAESLVLGPYVVLAKLGEGGMGQVFKARHHGLDKLAALKVLRAELVKDAEAVRRFYREIQIASQLTRHPNLVPALDAGPVGSTHFLAMEYIEGVDLEQLVRESGPLSVTTACDCIRQAACGLAHAFEHGLVHRDIKPSNLLLASGGRKPPVVSRGADATPLAASDSTGGLRPPPAVAPRSPRSEPNRPFPRPVNIRYNDGDIPASGPRKERTSWPSAKLTF
jgi:serine/threonine-protein kinase